MNVEVGSLDDIAVYRTESTSFATWSRVDIEITNSRAVFAAQDGGVYVAVTHSKAGLVAGAVIGSLLLVTVIVGGTYFYCRRNPETIANLRRSLQSKV